MLRVWWQMKDPGVGISQSLAKKFGTEARLRRILFEITEKLFPVETISPTICHRQSLFVQLTRKPRLGAKYATATIMFGGAEDASGFLAFFLV